MDSPDQPRLGPDSLAAIAELCARSLGRYAPTRNDLGRALFTPTRSDPPALVRGDPARGVVVSARRRGEGYIRLLAVDPEHQRQGLGTSLLRAAESDLAGCAHSIVGSDAPDYLFPGVPTGLTAMLCLLEGCGYQRGDSHMNLDVELDRLPPDPGGTRLGQGSDSPAVAQWADQHWPWWTDEMLGALERQRLLISDDDNGIGGVCAWDVTRQGWLGPIAVTPDRIGGRIGVPLLIGALHRLRAGGRQRAEIGWIGPVRFYVRTVGASVGDIYVVHRRRLHTKEKA